MTVYKIQVYLASVTGYDNVLTFTPDYVWTVAKVWRRWWLPWPRIEVGVINNLRPAEEATLTQALNQARIRRKKEPTRLLRVTALDGKETKTVVWDNGRVLDPSILSWYWRIVYWFFGWIGKPPEKKPDKRPEKK